MYGRPPFAWVQVGPACSQLAQCGCWCSLVQIGNMCHLKSTRVNLIQLLLLLSGSCIRLVCVFCVCLVCADHYVCLVSCLCLVCHLVVSGLCLLCVDNYVSDLLLVSCLSLVCVLYVSIITCVLSLARAWSVSIIGWLSPACVLFVVCLVCRLSLVCADHCVSGRYHDHCLFDH